MNPQTQAIINHLLREFPTQLQEKESFISKNPIGIEIEVKWKSYFPTLWDKYLQNTAYSDLPIHLKKSLNQECDKEELLILPNLNKTVECGIQKGKDKYWEFAFEPVTQINLLDYQLQILQAHKLIPNGEHSLHITIGNMLITQDVYSLLLLLEMISCTSDRIQSGFHQTNPKMSATWAKKGYGGAFQKNANQLKYNTSVATELRTLNLNTKNNHYHLLKITAYLSDIIIDKQNNAYNPLIEQWNSFTHEIKQILISFNLPNKNWKKPNLYPSHWLTYIQNYQHIKHLIIPKFEQYFPILSSITNNQKN